MGKGYPAYISIVSFLVCVKFSCTSDLLFSYTYYDNTNHCPVQTICLRVGERRDGGRLPPAKTSVQN